MPRKTRKVKPDPKSIINCGNPGDATMAYMAMFRYAFGRMTYMPGVITDIIRANVDTLTDKCLTLLDRDLTDAAKHYEDVYKDSKEKLSNYGMECDRQMWNAFHMWVKAQISKRERAQEESENALGKRH